MLPRYRHAIATAGINAGTDDLNMSCKWDTDESEDNGADGRFLYVWTNKPCSRYDAHPSPSSSGQATARSAGVGKSNETLLSHHKKKTWAS